MLASADYTMSPAGVAILINPAPSSNRFPKFDIHRKTPFSSSILNLKESEFVNRKSVRLKYTMAARSESIESGIPVGGDERGILDVSAFEQETLIDNGGVSFHQTVGGLHTFFNRASKWIVSATFIGLVLLKHDGFTFWAVMGSVLNSMLSITLKKTLKQERPVSGVSSGHGMPSSHAQSIFYTIIFIIASVFQWHGFNGVTAIVSMLVVAFGSYFSWLRVSQRYHTTSQVVVGAIVGSVFSTLWVWSWETTVQKAYDSNLWVRILVMVGAACFSLGFISHVFRHWVKGED